MEDHFMGVLSRKFPYREHFFLFVLRENFKNLSEERRSINIGFRWGSAVGCLMRLSSILCVLHVQRMER
jgi:hypothetical protein